MTRPLPVLLLALLAPWPAAAVDLADPSDAVLTALQTELEALSGLIGPTGTEALDSQPLFASNPAYHIGLQAVQLHRVSLIAEEGGLQGWAPLEGRWIHADIRVGSPTFDSSHALRDGSWDDLSSGRTLTLGDDVPLLRRTLREEAEVRYRGAVDRYQRVLNDRQVRVSEREAFDLAPAPALTLLDPLPSTAAEDWTPWEDLVRRVSSEFAQSDVALDPSVSLTVETETRWFVSTDGTVARTTDRRVRFGAMADSRAEDGTALFEDFAYDAHSLDGLPGEDTLRSEARAVLERLSALRAAPEEPPYRGPALLSGRAAAVFFHEILGHRVEGHRLKQVADAQTFRDKVGEPVLPSFLSVIDDPTRASVGGVDLRGHYAIDDQGVAAQRAVIVSDGVLQGFLESRSPVQDGAGSNGHGRRQAGLAAVTRQGNLIVESSRALDEPALRAELIDLARQQGLPYALYVLDLEGGFTFTDRDLPNAFQIDVRNALRVYVDGRPDELVRGVDLIGTPLQTFSRIVATGTAPAVFNGTCGAESGWVPVSAVAPPMLFSQVESQRKMKGQDPPPLTGPPPSDAELGPLPLLSLLAAEAERARTSLSLPDGPPPQRVTVETWDEDSWEVAANFGVLSGAGGGRSRPARVEVVVGDDTLSSLRFDGGAELELPQAWGTPRFVVDDVQPAVRRDLWLAADEAYRSAVQRLNLKKAELATRPPSERPPDWTAAPPLVRLDPAPIPRIDRAALTARALALSQGLRGVAGLRMARAAVHEEQGRWLYVDTDGARIALPDGYAAMQLALEAVRADGVIVQDRLHWVARSFADLPSLEVMLAESKEAAAALQSKVRVPLVGFFEGPVVFEGEAAADFFRYLLSAELRGTPAPLEAGRSEAEQERREPRLGRRLLPAGWSARDEPGSTPDGMAGARPVDREGVPARPVQLIEDGYVSDLVMTRVPRKDRARSTGAARGGIGTSPSARLSWWSVEPRRGVSAGAFARKVVAARKAAHADGVLIVRRLDSGWDGELPAVLDAVWRLADGSELPAVGLSFENVDRRTLRQVSAATSARTQRSYLGPYRPLGSAPATRGIPLGVQAPASILVEDLELVFAGASEQPTLLPPVALDEDTP